MRTTTLPPDLTASLEYDLPKYPVAQNEYTDVYKGTCRNHDGTKTQVAVKVLKTEFGQIADAEKLSLLDLRQWGELRHPNLLPLLGYAHEEDETSRSGVRISRTIITKWMENGNVLQFVKKNPDANIARLTLGMANGLAYLHERKIVHADFRSSNVLVSDCYEAVICDLGFSRVTHQLIAYRETTETYAIPPAPRWMAYELLTGQAEEPTMESDIWALGMTVYEIMAKQLPYAHLGHDALAFVEILHLRLPHLPEEPRKDYERQLWDICNKCWVCDPSERPTMAEISTLVACMPESSEATIGQRRSEETTDGYRRALTGLGHLDLTSSISYETKWPVAEGGYGSVFKGKYKQDDQSEMRVAIKRLRIYMRDALRNFKREIKAWSRLNHSNVLPLLGYVIEETGPHVSFALVSKWMENGNVLDFAKRTPGCDIVKLALDMASGLAYIHEKNIVHSDIKSGNVLVSNSHDAVICDFGSAHITHDLSSLSKSSEVSGLRGTPRWLAYELLSDQRNTRKPQKHQIPGHLV